MQADAPTRREYAWASAVAVTVLLALLAADVGVRESVVTVPWVRAALCEDEVRVTITNQHGEPRLEKPASGIHVVVEEHGDPVPARLQLYTKAPGGDWRLYWEISAPGGKEIFYLPYVEEGTGARVHAKSLDRPFCLARSEAIWAESP